MSLFQKKKTNYGKIIAITLGAIAGIAVIAFVVYKIMQKRNAEVEYDCDDLLDECGDCDMLCDDLDDAEEVVEAE
ncbi:MAG: hypothetical protein IJY42_04535 [Clostridia bacterium]|nr:hypothetical protein [Clostridia bacterium]